LATFSCTPPWWTSRKENMAEVQSDMLLVVDDRTSLRTAWVKTIVTADGRRTWEEWSLDSTYKQQATRLQCHGQPSNEGLDYIKQSWRINQIYLCIDMKRFTEGSFKRSDFSFALPLGISKDSGKHDNVKITSYIRTKTR
jgi:hypothetical protein